MHMVRDWFSFIVVDLIHILQNYFNGPGKILP